MESRDSIVGIQRAPFPSDLIIIKTKLSQLPIGGICSEGKENYDRDRMRNDTTGLSLETGTVKY